MTDDQGNKPKLSEAEVANIDAITARVKSGQPILNFLIEPPFNCTVESNMLHMTPLASA
ncbi:hypothetical protein [Paraburkholderia diazotrophica]|uniref:hypothetical protein n=1 Tax=Paraburkholderia diazotrophica TaxID=667676 RepID=UPI00317C6F39